RQGRRGAVIPINHEDHEEVRRSRSKPTWGSLRELRGLRGYFLKARTTPSNNALKSPVGQKFSVCHCTPRQNARDGSSSASITPSSAVTGTMRPSPHTND